MIYFDKDKNAYGFEIENPIAIIPDEIWVNYAGTDKWDIVNGEFKDITNTAEYKAKQAREEQERVNNLFMTPLDFLKVLQGFGIDLPTINAFLEQNLNIKMQLTYCNSVFCGVVKTFLPITIGDKTITAEMIEQVFKDKAGI